MSYLLKLILTFLVHEVNKPSPYLVTVLKVKFYGFSDFTIIEGFSSVLLKCHWT